MKVLCNAFCVPSGCASLSFFILSAETKKNSTTCQGVSVGRDLLHTEKEVASRDEMHALRRVHERCCVRRQGEKRCPQLGQQAFSLPVGPSPWALALWTPLAHTPQVVCLEVFEFCVVWLLFCSRAILSVAIASHAGHPMLDIHAAQMHLLANSWH